MSRLRKAWVGRRLGNDAATGVSKGVDEAGKKGDGSPKQVSAGDGSEAAYQRIRSKRYRSGQRYRDQSRRIRGT